MGELAAAFGIGLLATLSPCALPLYPGFLAYLAGGGAGNGGSTRWLGLFVLAGVLTVMLAVGALVAALSLAIGSVLAFVTPVAALAVIALGTALLLGRNPFARLPMLAGGRSGGPAWRSAFVYGMFYGPLALPCSGAFVVSLFTLSLTIGTFAERLLFFLVFGLGLGLPLLAISLLTDGRRRALLGVFTRHYSVISRIAGVALVALGLHELAVGLEAVRLQSGR